MTFHQDGAVGGGVFMQDADSTMVEVMTAADGGLWAAAVAAGSCGGACVRGAQRWLRSCGAFVRSLLLQPSLAVAAHDDVRRWAKPSL
jgi:hypothetical protein